MSIVPKYFFKNGFRLVYPYTLTHSVVCKGRWYGKRLIDTLPKEISPRKFHFYWEENIEKGKVLINGNIASPDYVMKPGDIFTHTYHRHEAPVTAKPLKIESHGEDFIAINKPSTIPIHPVSQFLYNTVINILKYEHSIDVHTVNRLDRLTSGLLVYPLRPELASICTAAFTKKKIKKKYVAKVIGKFPEHIEVDKPLKVKLLRTEVADDGIEAKTSFRLMSYHEDSNTSIILCEPETGRPHQIRVHLQYLGFPIPNDPIYSGEHYEELQKKQPNHEPIHISNHDPSYFDPTCKFCNDNHFITPRSEELWLHAYYYEGPFWKFEIDLPDWAKSNNWV